MKKNRMKILLAAVLCVGLLFMAGCGVKILKEKVETIESTITEAVETVESTITETVEEIVSSSSDSQESAYSGYVEIPEGTVVIEYEEDLDKLREELAEALANCETSVCVKDWIWLQTTDYYALPYSTFWLKDYSATGLIGKQKGEDTAHTYHFYEYNYYDLSPEEISRMKEQIDEVTYAIISLIPDGADDWTKAKIVHDELCKLVTYDETMEQPHTHDTYGALVNHEAVCSGYACAFSHIMSQMGYYCPLSYSDVHAWNHLAVISEEAYIDTTWDDLDLTDAYGNEYIDYSFFFLTREEMESLESHAISSGDPYYTSPDSERYNYYAHEGYLVSVYDWNIIAEMLTRQYQSGSNLLTIRFENEEDYQMALQWADTDLSELNDLMTQWDYYEPYYYWSNDDLRTYSIGLYAPAEEDPADF